MYLDCKFGLNLSLSEITLLFDLTLYLDRTLAQRKAQRKANSKVAQCMSMTERQTDRQKDGPWNWLIAIGKIDCQECHLKKLLHRTTTHHVIRHFAQPLDEDSQQLNESGLHRSFNAVRPTAGVGLNQHLSAAIHPNTTQQSLPPKPSSLKPTTTTVMMHKEHLCIDRQLRS